MSKRKRPHHRRQLNSKILLTLPEVRLLKDALCSFERVLVRISEKSPNVPFAKEVVAGLKTKLDEMLQQEEWEKATPLDYNEICVLYAVLHIHLLALRDSQEKSRIQVCLALCQRFAPIAEQAGITYSAE